MSGKYEIKTPGAASIQMAHGTTTLGFMFKEGIIIAVDSRATQGSYISSGTTVKTIGINKYLIGTMAGGAADCQYWERELGRQVRLFELRNHMERVSVSTASKILANIMYAYRGYDLSMGTMIAGWDTNGPALYHVDNDGNRFQGNLFSVGSGSPYAYGVVDAEWKWDMTVEEAAELGRRAVYHATHRDSASGGLVNVFYVNKDGYYRVTSDDSNKLHYEKYGNTADAEHTLDLDAIIPK